jgi:S-adenosylmethionine synthetase
MVDTYGGLALHGGGAFSGKDATKVDRSGAYMARMVAKHIVASGLAKRCGVSISYAIGKAEPVAVDVHTFSTGKFPDEKLAKAVRDVFFLNPSDMIEFLDLRKPIYRTTASYGHFGDKAVPWERTDPFIADTIKFELENDF